MSKLEQLANDIALLSKEDLSKLAQILVQDYQICADSLQSNLCWAEFDSQVA